MQHIHCTVDNCFYWESDNICLAEEIVVMTDAASTKVSPNVDANNMMEIANEIGATPAKTCMETCCKTFRSKNEGAGPVKKMALNQYSKS